MRDDIRRDVGRKAETFFEDIARHLHLLRARTERLRESAIRGR